VGPLPLIVGSARDRSRPTAGGRCGERALAVGAPVTTRPAGLAEPAAPGEVSAAQATKMLTDRPHDRRVGRCQTQPGADPGPGGTGYHNRRSQGSHLPATSGQPSAARAAWTSRHSCAPTGRDAPPPSRLPSDPPVAGACRHAGGRPRPGCLPPPAQLSPPIGPGARSAARGRRVGGRPPPARAAHPLAGSWWSGALTTVRDPTPNGRNREFLLLAGTTARRRGDAMGCPPLDVHAPEVYTNKCSISLSHSLTHSAASISNAAGRHRARLLGPAERRRDNVEREAGHRRPGVPG
jgi:hypothetical protein